MNYFSCPDALIVGGKSPHHSICAIDDEFSGRRFGRLRFRVFPRIRLSRVGTVRKTTLQRSCCRNLATLNAEPLMVEHSK